MSWHTTGPWEWYGDPAHEGVCLATVHGGRRRIMDFVRQGMNGAQPRFRNEKGIMVPASELCRFAVGDEGIVGLKSAKMNNSVYRYDISEIDHPDARLIAAAPDMLEALKLAEKLYQIGEGLLTKDEWNLLHKTRREAIAKATNQGE